MLGSRNLARNLGGLERWIFSTMIVRCKLTKFLYWLYRNLEPIRFRNLGSHRYAGSLVGD